MNIETYEVVKLDSTSHTSRMYLDVNKSINGKYLLVDYAGLGSLKDRVAKVYDAETYNFLGEKIVKNNLEGSISKGGKSSHTVTRFLDLR